MKVTLVSCDAPAAGLKVELYLSWECRRGETVSQDSDLDSSFFSSSDGSMGCSGADRKQLGMRIDVARAHTRSRLCLRL